MTVVRNDLPGLQLTWASLAAQTSGSWEWVVVDGDSDDGAAAWLEGLDDPRVSWVSEPDHGLYDAMNKGLWRAAGRLVTFLNAGDQFAGPGVLHEVRQHQQRGGWLWAYGEMDLVGAEGEGGRHLALHPYRHSSFRWGRQTVPHAASWFDTDFARALGGYRLDFPVAADQQFMLRAAAQHPPGELSITLTIFALGGLSSRTRPDEWVWEARRIRLEQEGRRPLLDIVTVALSIERRGRVALRRMTRTGDFRKPPGR